MPGKKYKSDRHAELASELYMSGHSVDAVATELGLDYRTARKAITAVVPLRDAHARLVGRTRPDRKKP